MTKTGAFLFIFLPGLLLQAQYTYIQTVDNAVFGRDAVVEPAGNGGYLLFSKSTSYLSRFNHCGEELFSRNIIMPGSPDIVDFIALKNGDLCILAMSQNARRDAIVVRLDSSGTPVWDYSYKDVPGQQRQFVYKIMEDQQSNLLIYGNLENASSNEVRSFLLKIDAMGLPIWTETYDIGGIWGGALLAKDNGVLLRNGNRFIKVDQNGAVEWAKTYTLPSNNSDFLPAVEVKDGYVFAGTQSGSEFGYIYKVDTTGEVDTACSLNLRGSLTPPSSNDSGEVYLGINTLDPTGSGNLRIIRFDNELELVNELSLAATYQALDMAVLSNNTMAIGGNFITLQTRSFSAVTTSDLFVGCSQSSPALQFSALSFSSTDINVVQNRIPFEIQSYAVNIANPNLTYDLGCNADPVLELGPDRTICEGSSTILGSVFPGQFSAFTWSTGANTPSIEVQDSGTYWLTVSVLCGQDQLTDTIHVSVEDNPDFDLGPNRFLCSGETILLEGPECSNCSYLWSNGSTDRTSLINSPGRYSLTVERANGCIRSDEIIASTDGCFCDVFIPNAFSPNDDSKNEFFRPILNCELRTYKFQVFDRWGKLIFDSRDPFIPWDGRSQGEFVSPGIYMYALEYTPFVRGEVKDKRYHRGTLTVLR